MGVFACGDPSSVSTNTLVATRRWTACVAEGRILGGADYLAAKACSKVISLSNVLIEFYIEGGGCLTKADRFLEVICV